MNLLDYKYEDLDNIKGWVSPRDCMVELFGGAVILAKVLGLSVATVYRWKNGVIPHKHQYRILQLLDSHWASSDHPYSNATFSVSYLIEGKIK